MICYLENYNKKRRQRLSSETKFYTLQLCVYANIPTKTY